MARLIVPVGMQGVRVVVVLAVAAVLTVATVLAPGCVGKDSATEDVEWAAEDDLQPDSHGDVQEGPSDAPGDDAEEVLATAPVEGATGHDARRASVGVCSRCHVVEVLEWGVSKHAEVRTTCKRCHGPSVGHVANERNEVKPDRLPRGEAIAGLCSNCHEDGCPDTAATANCQECHHVHALLDVSKDLPVDDAFDVFVARQKEFRERMDEGERLVKLETWEAARAAFLDALEILPGNDEAEACVKMCSYRLRGAIPGFDGAGGTVDEQVGLPRRVKVSGLALPMVLIPSGEFDLGDDRFADSRPVHTVEVDAFYLGVYEVTQAEWQQVMGTNPSAQQGAAGDDSALLPVRLPVERVSWEDCQVFIEKLNEQVPGGGFRLPTEAEWEFACRSGGEVSLAPEELNLRAWYYGNSPRAQARPSAFPVGIRTPNAWGLFDMQGNVSEWCADLLRPYLADRSEAPESGDSRNLRVLRGGSYNDGATGLHPAMRHGERPHRRLRWNGLRLARSVPE